MKNVTAFKTSDGKLFEFQKDAEDHEFGKLMSEKLNEFSRQECCPYPDGVANQQMRKSIIAWELAKPRIDTGAATEVLGFTARTQACLNSEGIKTIEDLLKNTKNDLLRVPNLGRKSLDEVIEVLEAKGLKLAT